MCHLYLVAQIKATLIPKLQVQFVEFLQHYSLNALVYSTYPPVSVYSTVLILELFPESSRPHIESINDTQLSTSVTSSRLTNIDVIPIDYAFRPRLRGRLTLRRLTLHKKPWIFGGNVSHISLCYSCRHSLL